MTMFIANFGIGNRLWDRCRESSVALTYDDDDESWPLWLAGDKPGYVAYTMKHKTTHRGIEVTKPVAARWFNLLSEVRDSDHDIWVHREKEDLWWTTTTDKPAQVSRIEAPWPKPRTQYVHLIEKPTEPWRNTSRTGARLLWSGLHPKARQFLFTEGTLQQPSPDNAEYARALLDGDDLRPWHTQADWKALEERAGHGEVRSFGSWQKAALRMALTAESTARASLADPKLKAPKLKRFAFRSAHELAEYVAALLEAQDYTCALSELSLQSDGDVQDREFLASLDRIDSAGHYEPGNLQVVCQFINRWKSDSDNVAFLRLINILRGRTSDEDSG